MALPQPQSDTAAAITTAVKEVYAQNTYAADDLRDGDDGDDGDDDDDVIENSEDETAGVTNTSSMRHVLKKRKVHDVRPQIVSQQQVNKSKAASEYVKLEEESVETQPTTPKKPSTRATKTPKTASRVTVKKTPKIKISPKVKVSPKLTATPSTPARRSSRRAVCKTSQCPNTPSSSVVAPFHENDDDKEEMEEEPATDSDGDPEFKPTAEKQHLDNSSDDEKENPPKVARKVAARSRAAKKTATPSRKTKSKAPVAPTDPDEQDDDEQKEYDLEFGTGFTNCVPRIDVTELQTNTRVFQNYVHSIGGGAVAQAKTAPMATVNEAIDVPLTKRELERAKLEKKITSGSLNDNYVRVNIQKKKFSRGHKTTNFSKYKKSEWRKTKAANALAGPEMDMRGCDGGFLVCFECGQQGHFAQDCKMQSDRLLSLNAVEEESEFPTLAEVESMAQEQAKLVHASRPESLPAAASGVRKFGVEIDEGEDGELSYMKRSDSCGLVDSRKI